MSLYKLTGLIMLSGLLMFAYSYNAEGQVGMIVDMVIPG